MLIRVCSTLIHPRNIDFPSESRDNVIHTVVSPTILNDAFCTCEGWLFRDECKHVRYVLEHECDWSVGPADQYQSIQECPNCGEPVEDFETDAEYE